jgi:hypothetical protein
MDLAQPGDSPGCARHRRPRVCNDWRGRLRVTVGYSTDQAAGTTSGRGHPEREREILGLWWQDKEGDKFWLAVLNDPPRRQRHPDRLRRRSDRLLGRDRRRPPGLRTCAAATAPRQRLQEPMPFGASRTSAFRQTPIRLLITEVGRAELTNWRTEGALAFALYERGPRVKSLAG